MQTYAGLASMLAEDFETIIPSTLPRQGLRVPRAELQGHRARGSAPPIASSEKTVVRAGFGIYYNPNQMNSFTFLTNNPPLAAVTTYTSDPANPTLSFSTPDRRGRTGGTAGHDLADARSAQRAQGSVELRSAARAVAQHGARHQYVGSNTSHLDRSFFNNTPHARCRAPSIRGGRARSSAAAA